jgi:LacI family transcriptional regulator
MGHLQEVNVSTIDEVAKLANVSKTTVSRVINRHTTVKDKNRQKVLAAMEELNFKPNSFAQALASSRSNSIGMLVGTLGGPFYGVLMHHAEIELRRQNIHLITSSGQESEKIERDGIHFLQSKMVDGMIIHADTLHDDELIDIVKRYPKTVILNRNIPEITEHCLFLDNELGGYLATKYLIDTGHKQIGCLTGQLSKADSRDRLFGYRKALSEAGMAYNPSLVVEGRFDSETPIDAGKRLFKRDLNVDAVFCQNDQLALSMYTIAAEYGKVVGKDISIIGYDNDHYTMHLQPSLTTMHYPLQDMAMLAVDKVLAMVNGDKIYPSDMLKPWVIERNSVNTQNQIK